MKVVARFALGAHRLLLVVGTALLAIAASQLASDLSSNGAWLALLGGGILMHSSEVASDLEADARELSRSTDEVMSTARGDILQRGQALRIAIWIFAGVALIVWGFALGLT